MGTDTIGERELAALVGAALSTVQNRRSRGWLPSFHKDEQGRWRAPREAALAEWRVLKRRPTARTSAVPVAPSVAAAVAEQLVAVVTEEFDALRDRAVRLVPAVVAGAVEGLQQAGRAPTAEALGFVFDLGSEDAGLFAFPNLYDLVGFGPPDETEAARQVGRAEARKRCDGNL